MEKITNANAVCNPPVRWSKYTFASKVNILPSLRGRYLSQSLPLPSPATRKCKKNEMEACVLKM